MRHVTAVLVPLALAGCLFDAAPETLQITGQTMGTTYSVTVVDPAEGVDAEALAARVDAVLADVNAKMSNWDPNSEVSRFNAAATTDPVAISADFAEVMAAAMAVHARSEGRFDVTLAPLIELWGFGPRTPDSPVPADDAIAAALEAVGQAGVLRLEGETLAKARAEVSVNLSAIAKGFGVDAVARALAEDGMDRYLVEIGGDLAASGLNGDDAPWRVGIERPDSGAGLVEEIVTLTGAGLATSGDYRNYFEADGVRYSHIIDPATGRPIAHRTASATVVADSAMMADAWATAMLALDDTAALRVAEAEGLAVFLILREGDSFVTVASDAFRARMSDTDG